MNLYWQNRHRSCVLSPPRPPINSFWELSRHRSVHSSPFKLLTAALARLTEIRLPCLPCLGLLSSFVSNHCLLVTISRLICDPQRHLRALHINSSLKIGQSAVSAQHCPRRAPRAVHTHTRVRAHTRKHTCPQTESSLTFVGGVDDGERRDNAGQ